MGTRWSRREFLEAAGVGTAAFAASPVVDANAGPGLAPGAQAAQRPQPTQGLQAQQAASLSVSVFSKHLQHLDYRALAETVAEAGFDGIDLTVRAGGHVLPERVKDDLPKAVEAARAAGLTLPMITTTIVSAGEPHAEAILETAGRLGVRDYRLGPIPYDEAKGVAGTLDALRSPLRDLAALNQRCGIRGGYQNHAGERVGAAIWDLWMVLREVGSPWLGAQYDIRHAVIEGSASWPNGLRLIAPFVHTVDVKDGCWERTPKGWRANTVPLGEGAVDLVAFFRLMGKLRLVKPISAHFEYPFPEQGSAAERRKAAVALMRKDRERLRDAMDEAGYRGRS
jgi:sugar phosphate isomerase/epimerase